jgi:hypothetical protein
MIPSKDGAMQKIAKLVANASRSFACMACLMVLASGCFLSLGAQQSNEVAQATIAYGFLVSHYPNEFLVAPEPTIRAAQDMKDLGNALESLHCDIPTRLAFPHSAIMVPPSLADRWLGFPSAAKNRSVGGWLFLIGPLGSASQRFLALLSSAGPARTTVFWLDKGKSGYVTKLIYDSFKKNELGRETTMIGRTTKVRLGKNNDILVKELVEPGSGPQRWQFATGRVFRIDLSQGTITLVLPKMLPRN